VLANVIEASGVPFSPHDCRRTFSTTAANLLPELVLKRLLNYAVGDDVTAGHYVHLGEADLRGAWQRVADRITKKAPQPPAAQWRSEGRPDHARKTAPGRGPD
jgi:hypothetical protein